ncbi:uncharacterized protein N7515_000463 [Penicillium bovifimosum]|uniref:RGS domain-containing protein n=1 Tax=Penicillium bovifimosum TaxID=126998 RepID=A0A9W9L9W7_9EURO|nr:uncharacterized protein N7515_000463 [Penicillium bovifimosum]KAJ5145899.1 hypothetical protein N7515_000463 [Penicillium bovifimosum]
MSLNQDSSAALQAEQKPISLPTILKDILSDKAPKPYTAGAFFDFAAAKHCTESIDFIVKAQNYHDLYPSLQSFMHEKVTQEAASVGEEWGYLMRTFISPGSPCELNLPSSIRNELLSHDPMLIPPPPVDLEPAVQHTSETLIDNVLIPFLKSSPVLDSSASLTPPTPSNQWAALSDRFSAKRPPIKRTPSILKEIGHTLSQFWKRAADRDPDK